MRLIADEWGSAQGPTTKTLLICATTATFLNDSLREALVIPYIMQFPHSVGETVGCVQVGRRKRSRWAVNVAFRGTMASVFGFTMRCEQNMSLRPIRGEDLWKSQQKQR